MYNSNAYTLQFSQISLSLEQLSIEVLYEKGVDVVENYTYRYTYPQIIFIFNFLNPHRSTVEVPLICIVNSRLIYCKQHYTMHKRYTIMTH